MFRTLITHPLGYILGFIYSFVANYGWALILFTLAVKLILLPLGLKQQKSMTKMQLVQPKMQEIQKKYENDKQKQSEETMKLYKEYNISPMGGCLPLLIQLPILIGLYRVIQEPLTYMLHNSAEEIALWKSQLNLTSEIDIAKLKDLVEFNFLGLDLSVTPNFGKLDWIWLIPILAGITTFLTSKITTWMNGKDKKPAEEKKPARVLNPDQKTPSNTEGTMKTMTYIMPLMTAWIAFSFPAALGLYWTISNVLSMAQTVVLNGYYANKLKSEFAALEEKKALEAAERKQRRKRG